MRCFSFLSCGVSCYFFFFQAEDGIRDLIVTGVQTCALPISLAGEKKRTLKQIIEDLRNIYCGTLACEFMHIPDSAERIWVQERVEEMCTARRSEERRVGKECSARGGGDHEKKREKAERQ